MADIFFKTIDIENYKCFEYASIDLNRPDGSTARSCLNILIGENGNINPGIHKFFNLIKIWF